MKSARKSSKSKTAKSELKPPAKTDRDHIAEATEIAIEPEPTPIDPKCKRKSSKSKPAETVPERATPANADNDKHAGASEHYPTDAKSARGPTESEAAETDPEPPAPANGDNDEPHPADAKSTRNSTKSKPAKTPRNSKNKKTTADTEPLPKRKRFNTDDEHLTPKVASTRSARRLNVTVQLPKRATKRAADDGDLVDDDDDDNGKTLAQLQSTPHAKRNTKSIKDYFSPTTSPMDADAPAPETDTPKTTKSDLLKNAPVAKKPKKTQSEEVTCGNCREVLKRIDWKQHFKFHYGQAWIDGEEEPLVSGVCCNLYCPFLRF